MPWWSWIIVVIGAFALLVVIVGTRYQNKVRREFVALLAEKYPQFQVVEQNNDKLSLRMPDGGEGEIHLDNLFNGIHRIKANTPEERRAVYEQFASSLLADMEEYNRKLDPASDSARVMPRLVTADFLAALPAEAKVPTRALGTTGLHVAYVLDSPKRVNYITAKHGEELRLTNDQLHELALTNLRKTTSKDLAREAVSGQLVVSKSLDTYDAARLLLVPETLNDGEAVVAAVPDRDTLAMISIPRDQAKGFPMTPDNTDHLLLDKPLWVTRDGIEIA
jgi:uncharacterized protein YtpQ (UPF0354 family)